ncbi:hypothetical protein [Capnocytophaga canimorsus]|uniref:Uncharacterized protein n=2 Tax=Capnocytophaga canimorsus TaxID=28188 RepID=F9YP81_CAPCC|nr:hypothetical protein [Capnocytophaga canimorsus]AEK23275.1 Hypothetical protein Ccan_11590 [Capnocytophaga canimorsus Cc5]ATA76413.1 hypothetical protein CGC47_01775 [Capnocytophaga canimorsus]PJI79630.1 hypothetical protein CLV61_1518 [Capnocytophaga canimorsus]WGU71041.1 hypothetical protein QIU18_03330 [Capnocytophaga canimorsus]CEN34000.1 conserved hypothetical protein [Capnocytophaga canimorsus]
MKKYNYIIGIFLIILGCLSGIILDTLGFILAILGIVLVLLSKQKVWIKLLTIFLLPIILVYGMFIFIFSNS